jgi:hypothetical protein
LRSRRIVIEERVENRIELLRDYCPACFGKEQLHSVIMGRPSAQDGGVKHRMKAPTAVCMQPLAAIHTRRIRRQENRPATRSRRTNIRTEPVDLPANPGAVSRHLDPTIAGKAISSNHRRIEPGRRRFIGVGGRSAKQGLDQVDGAERIKVRLLMSDDPDLVISIELLDNIRGMVQHRGARRRVIIRTREMVVNDERLLRSRRARLAVAKAASAHIDHDLVVAKHGSIRRVRGVTKRSFTALE